MALCDCRDSTDAHGLLCHGEGYFITGFTNTAKWQADHSTVPLGSAKCCRVCLEETPDAALHTPEERGGGVPSPPKAIEVLSLGCQQSPDPVTSGMQCEAGSYSVVAGFQASHELKE